LGSAVALFTLYPGFDPKVIRQVAASGVLGIVLAAYGAGTACTRPGRYDVSAAVRAVTRAGVRVAVVSQHYGRVREAYGSTVDLVRAGAQLMPETTPEAALAALMCRCKGGGIGV
jgi:L-asparaginase/Glu-tRNA(Gln) amidotransferase subunit D